MYLNKYTLSKSVDVLFLFPDLLDSKLVSRGQGGDLQLWDSRIEFKSISDQLKLPDVLN